MALRLQHVWTDMTMNQRTGKPVDIKVCTHVNTSNVYAPNGKRECARRRRQMAKARRP
jgi:hypothetical protein